MVEVNFRFPFVHRRLPISASHGPVYKVKEETGKVSATYSDETRLPHPVNMSNYDEWSNDPEASIAFNVLTDIIAGVGFYTEMGEEEEPTHKNKERIDEYAETVNLDEDLQQIVMAMLQKGFCPVERLSDYDLKVLPPESFYIYRDKKGNVLKYTQERSVGDEIAAWKGAEMDDIILFIHRETTSWPYGKSLVEPIGPLLDERAQMNLDMPKAIHRWAYPLPVVSTMGPRDQLQKAFEDRDVDEGIFIGNAKPEEIKLDVLNIDPQARFIPYIELIYYQICEGLHAPLLLYLKNATEASATVMMESVDRLVNGIQRYVKRRVERFLFEPQVGRPVPKLMWGQPKTGLEEVTLDQIAAILPYLAKNQQQELLQKFVGDLPEPEWPKEQPMPMPMQPFQKPQPQMPTQDALEKVGDMNTALSIIQTNFQEKRISTIEAMKIGGAAIEAYLGRAYGKGSVKYEEIREIEFQKFVRKLIGAKDGKVYTVSVGD